MICYIYDFKEFFMESPMFLTGATMGASCSSCNGCAGCLACPLCAICGPSAATLVAASASYAVGAHLVNTVGFGE